jgi:hypothetical protein
MSTWTRWMLVTIATCAAACGSPPSTADAGPEPSDAGTDARPARMRTSMAAPSGAECPPGSTLTYESFGEAFFEDYCVRCHSSTLTTSTERNGAPAGFDFDTAAGVELRASEIDAVAAGGPTRINIFMPLGTPAPTDEERDMLGEWIACGTP